MAKELRTYRFDSKTISIIEKLAFNLGLERTEVIKRAVNTFEKLYGNGKKGYSYAKGSENNSVNT